MLFGTVGKAGEGAPCRQSVLFGAVGKVDVEEGKIVCLITGEATRSREGLWRTWWSDRDHVDLLQEIDFLRTIILLERSEVTRCLVGARVELFESLHKIDRLRVVGEITRAPC